LLGSICINSLDSAVTPREEDILMNLVSYLLTCFGWHPEWTHWSFRTTRVNIWYSLNLDLRHLFLLGLFWWSRVKLLILREQCINISLVNNYITERSNNLFWLRKLISSGWIWIKTLRYTFLFFNHAWYIWFCYA